MAPVRNRYTWTIFACMLAGGGLFRLVDLLPGGLSQALGAVAACVICLLFSIFVASIRARSKVRR